MGGVCNSIKTEDKMLVRRQSILIRTSARVLLYFQQPRERPERYQTIASFLSSEVRRLVAVAIGREGGVKGRAQTKSPLLGSLLAVNPPPHTYYISPNQ